ncbi:flagellin [Phenylobacterium sp.]|uniref:flagellin n=1 Tax=Phenylobacterium sp. TaxID=1871053 RepID=UPI002E3033E1|nr:flagellin [Phenylobacterium sp.]HEX4710636.1 flagellin [Phenylobacterium sp.]
MTAEDLRKGPLPMAFSVNTNVGAMVALQNLNSTQSSLMTTENRINTGLKVASAKDNAAVWAIAQGQRAVSSSLNSVVSSLQRGQSTVDVALSAGTSVSDLLNQMNEKALAASDTTLDTASRSALNDEFKSLRDQINKVVNNAVFNGANMLKSGGTTVKALANSDGTAVITVAAQDLSLGGSILTSALGTGATINTVTSATNMIATVNAAITAVSSAMGKLGTGDKALASHLTFIQSLQNTIDAGIGNMVDADLAKESANLQALQTKQQLGIQALSIANQSSSSLLGLFR